MLSPLSRRGQVAALVDPSKKLTSPKPLARASSAPAGKRLSRQDAARRAALAKQAAEAEVFASQIHSRILERDARLAWEAQQRKREYAEVQRQAEHQKELLRRMQRSLRSPITDSNFRIGGGRILPLYQSERLVAQMDQHFQGQPMKAAKAAAGGRASSHQQRQWPGRPRIPSRPSSALVSDVSRLEDLMVAPLHSPGRRRRPTTPSLQQVLSRTSSSSHETAGFSHPQPHQEPRPPTSTFGGAPDTAPQADPPHANDGELQHATATTAATERELQTEGLEQEEKLRLFRPPPLRVTKSVPSFAPRVATGYYDYDNMMPTYNFAAMSLGAKARGLPTSGRNGALPRRALRRYARAAS